MQLFEKITIAATSCLVLHGAVAGMAILRIFLPMQNRKLQEPQAEADHGVLIDVQDNASSAALEAVLQMYSKGCLQEESFAPSISFRDPLVRTVGFEELQENSRVMRRLLRPFKVRKWQLTSVGGGQLEVVLWQRLRLKVGTKDVGLSSKVVAKYDKAGQILSIQDLWRQQPLLEFGPFTWSRRINGIVASWVTPVLVDPKEKVLAAHAREQKLAAARRDKAETSTPGPEEADHHQPSSPVPAGNMLASQSSREGVLTDATFILFALPCVALLNWWRRNRSSSIASGKEQTAHECLLDTVH
eukprot:gnl/TRDRNA2_/TRDRNA2_91419_c0_seq1.p1 gnl/TRDRNA2_/TRDRNA2_91419_c0~~gnl/TRDRNA2_/TRDRNA2_91419_c0_seq1.p1  ORF type:complete len:301 (-),score=38.83 gnl/TRDRNA2_/TRDRNA2_91419_c0_seq1:134-1036(-)